VQLPWGKTQAILLRCNCKIPQSDTHLGSCPSFSQFDFTNAQAGVSSFRTSNKDTLERPTLEGHGFCNQYNYVDQQTTNQSSKCRVRTLLKQWTQKPNVPDSMIHSLWAQGEPLNKKELETRILNRAGKGTKWKRLERRAR
jgi:hypothetical protein